MNVPSKTRATTTRRPQGFLSGSCALLGRVIDQDGRPVEGIAIDCEGGATTGTLADGSFLFEGLCPQRYAVRVGPSGYPGYRQIFARKEWWLALQADLTTGPGVLDLGEILVVRDRLFQVRGKIDADPSLHPLGGLHVRVEGLPPTWLALDPVNATFDHWFHPKDGPHELTFVVTEGREELARVPVLAAADQRVELVIPLR